MPSSTISSKDNSTVETNNRAGWARIENRVKHGCGFSVVEYVAVAKACVADSRDAIVGAEQMGDMFFGSIHGQYSSMLKPVTASSHYMESSKKCAELLMKSCNDFAACNVQVFCWTTSGANFHDYNRLNDALYNDCKVTVPDDDVIPDFKYDPASCELWEQPKFLMGLESSSVQPKSEGVAKLVDTLARLSPASKSRRLSLKLGDP